MTVELRNLAGETIYAIDLEPTWRNRRPEDQKRFL